MKLALAESELVMGPNARRSTTHSTRARYFQLWWRPVVHTHLPPGNTYSDPQCEVLPLHSHVSAKFGQFRNGKHPDVHRPDSANFGLFHSLVPS